MRKQENPCYGLLIVLVFVTSYVVAQSEAEIQKICETEENQRKCQKCISANPLCSWCEKIDLRTKRCTLYSENEKACVNSTTINPKSDFDVERDDNFTDAGPDFFDKPENVGKTVIQMRPQNITMKLRKGQPAKVNITFQKVIDYPLDIYYVMDLSFSMSDDLATLQNLGRSLFDSLKDNVTKNVQLGFGSFVDKVMMPFASTVQDQLENPCASQEGEVKCATPFGFRHQLPITGNDTAFEGAIQSTEISGNIDIPEGSFDALMQIAVCEHIEWRDGSTRVILLTTDASPHIAMDGKLAAILEANDMKCHLEKGANSRLPDDIVYARSKTMDYPSLGQLKDAFQKNKIHSIFAVTSEVLSLYQGIDQVLPNAYVAKLKADSSNIIPLIDQTYGELKARLTVETSKPPTYVTQTSKVYCPNSEAVTGGELKCDGIKINDTVIFEFEFTATDCPSDPNHRDSILLTSSSLQDEVTINLEYLCECDCQSKGVANSSECGHHGSLTCGVCDCEDGRDGTTCQCESETKNGTSVLDKCVKKGSDIRCEGKGSCDCGDCRCDDGFTGEFCECKTTGCPSDQDGPCGGSDKGSCKICPGEEEKRCRCIAPYSIEENLGTCTCHPKLCGQIGNTSVCNGRGKCACDTCECDQPEVWTGNKCDKCQDPSCTGVDATCNSVNISKCAECKSKGSDCSACDDLSDVLLYTSVTNFPNCENCDNPTKSGTSDCKQCGFWNNSDVKVTCQQTRQDYCNYNYQIVWNKKHNQFIVYVQNYDEDRDCPGPVDPLVIVLPTVGVVLLIGIVLLVAWKVYTTLRDKRQWEEFQEEAKRRKWTKGENPIFEKPEQKFANPMFSADNLDE